MDFGFSMSTQPEFGASPAEISAKKVKFQNFGFSARSKNIRWSILDTDIYIIDNYW
jgi:hypothetical protein